MSVSGPSTTPFVSAQTGSNFDCTTTAGTTPSTQPSIVSLPSQPTSGSQQQSTTSTQQQQPTTSTLLFGQLATGTQQPQQPPNGHSATGTRQLPLFGQLAVTGIQPATGASQSGQAATVAQQQQTHTTSLFSQPATGSQQSTSLFGQSPTGTQERSSLAGTTQLPQNASGTSTTQPNVTSMQMASLFGSTNQTTPSTSLFGAPVTNFGANTTSALLGVQRQPSTTSVSPIQPTGAVIFSKATKFNDLPEEMKKKFEDLEAYIQGRVQICNDLKQRKLGQEPTKGQDFIHDVHKELISVVATIQSDILFAKDLKGRTEQTVQDTIVATCIADGFRNPQQHGIHLKNHASFPLEFFTCVTNQLQERLQWYKNTIEQIERKLSSAAVQAQHFQTTPQVISSTLHTQHSTFVSLAAKTATVDADLQNIKTLYTQLWRERMRSMRDPFNDLDQGTEGHFGMESLCLP